MSRVSRKRFSCGHRGFGQFCHRCQQADHLEELTKSGKEYKAGRKKSWSKEELLVEAERLRKEGKGRY